MARAPRPGRWGKERVLVPSSQGRRASDPGAGTLGVLEVSSGTLSGRRLMGRADMGPGSHVPAPSGQELTPCSASSGEGGTSIWGLGLRVPHPPPPCGCDPAWTGGRACALGQQRHRAIRHLKPRSPASEPVFKAPGAKGPSKGRPPRVSPQPRRPHSNSPPGAFSPSTRTLLSRPSSSPTVLLTSSRGPLTPQCFWLEVLKRWSKPSGGPLPTAACPREPSLPSPRS